MNYSTSVGIPSKVRQNIYFLISKYLNSKFFSQIVKNNFITKFSRPTFVQKRVSFGNFQINFQTPVFNVTMRRLKFSSKFPALFVHRFSELQLGILIQFPFFHSSHKSLLIFSAQNFAEKKFSINILHDSFFVKFNYIFLKLFIA